MADPAKEAVIWCHACEKELMTWSSPAQIRNALSNKTAAKAQDFYRVPMPGEPVILAGMQRRPELNGAKAEIVSSSLDEMGRITVRVFNSTVHGMGDSKKMKVQPCRLMPSSSAPSLQAIRETGGTFDDDRSSVRSCSRVGSVVSLGASRVSGALSAAGRGALSNTGRSRPPGTPAASANMLA
eukprot:TRINITY_DN4846_c0_g1_i1.p1 TRINITY_DN4846_c0_g1~~TRINITY_DN4846_c0_g1_i1.p1  ORF type:complete len:183 (-),score=43.26 TRINITY_DN4846_c0_g1_i1:226-774(-)